jgi:predicted outer membrane lipoprotein
MRLSSGRGSETGGNWIILVALVAAFAAIVAAIFELKQDGAKYAKAFVREDALRILIVPELMDPMDAALHSFALAEDLEVERLYRSSAQVQAWLQGIPEAEALPPIDGVLHADSSSWTHSRAEVSQRIRFGAPSLGEARPVFARLTTSGRSLALDRLEAWFQSPACAAQLQAAGLADGLEVLPE